MKTEVIVPFFRYEPVYGDNYKVLFKFFQIHAKKWGQHVDKITIIDSGCNFLSEDVDPTFSLNIVAKPPQSHWQNLNEQIRNSDADIIILLDSDMIIYDPDVILSMRTVCETNADGIGIFDSSGGVDMSKYWLMAENENRFERRRFAPYLFALRKAALRPDFDFTPRGGENWTDSMGTITEQMIEDGKEIKELMDDRSTISLEDDGRITHVQWLDTPPKKWALMENPGTGYYHVRNFGGGLQIINTLFNQEMDKFGQLQSTIPFREAMRLLAWVEIMALKIGNEEIAGQAHYTAERFVKMEKWDEYLEEFQKYHSWLEDI